MPTRQKPKQEQVFVSADWIANRFGVSVATVRRWCKKGKLPPPVRMDRACRWPAALITRLMPDT